MTKGIFQAIEENNFEEVVSFLESADSEKHSLNENGQSALHVAILKNNPQIIQKLISAQIDVNIQDNFGNTALFYATINKKIESIDLLIDVQANPQLSNKSLRSPLIIALEFKDPIYWRALTRNDFATNTCDQNGSTLLMIAASKGDAEKIQQLLTRGADSELTNNNRENALMLAASHGVVKIIEIFLKEINYNKEKINLRNDNGQTALSCAATNGCTDAAGALLDADSDIDCVDKRGNTPLILASGNNQWECVQYLLKRGANPRLESNYFETALQIAKMYSYNKVAQVIEEYFKKELLSKIYRLINQQDPIFKIFQFLKNKELSNLLLSLGKEPKDLILGVRRKKSGEKIVRFLKERLAYKHRPKM